MAAGECAAMLPVPLRGAGLLDGTGAMTDNVRKPTTKVMRVAVESGGGPGQP